MGSCPLCSWAMDLAVHPSCAKHYFFFPNARQNHHHLILQSIATLINWQWCHTHSILLILLLCSRRSFALFLWLLCCSLMTDRPKFLMSCCRDGTPCHLWSWCSAIVREKTVFWCHWCPPNKEAETDTVRQGASQEMLDGRLAWTYSTVLWQITRMHFSY